MHACTAGSAVYQSSRRRFFVRLGLGDLRMSYANVLQCRSAVFDSNVLFLPSGLPKLRQVLSMKREKAVLCNFCFAKVQRAQRAHRQGLAKMSCQRSGQCQVSVSVMKGSGPQAEKAMEKCERKAWDSTAVVITVKISEVFTSCADAEASRKGHGHGLTGSRLGVCVSLMNMPTFNHPKTPNCKSSSPKPLIYSSPRRTAWLLWGTTCSCALEIYHKGSDVQVQLQLTATLQSTKFARPRLFCC